MSDEKQVKKTIKKLKDQRDEALAEATNLKGLAEVAVQKATTDLRSEISFLHEEVAHRNNVIRKHESDQVLFEAKTRETEQKLREAEASIQTLTEKHEWQTKKIEELVIATEDADIKRYQKRLREKSEENDRLKTQLKQTEEECRALALIAQKMQAEVLWLREPKVPAPVASVTLDQSAPESNPS
jgi:chromosome segregation ATPase